MIVDYPDQLIDQLRMPTDCLRPAGARLETVTEHLTPLLQGLVQQCKDRRTLRSTAICLGAQDRKLSQQMGATYHAARWSRG